jgi:flavin reductase (DIM6/NTAB) family NADH-FMN oxidoreductase RutF
MRAFPQGVTIVTTLTPDGPCGLTVSAFTSVSIEPPLAMVSISKTSHVHSCFMGSNGFAVNFLADDQKSISERFARGDETAERFRGMNYTAGLTGSPVIQGVRAVVECKKWRVYDGGDHSILIGEVVRAQKLNDRPPLVYYGQQYTTTEKQDASRTGETV